MHLILFVVNVFYTDATYLLRSTIFAKVHLNNSLIEPYHRGKLKCALSCTFSFVPRYTQVIEVPLKSNPKKVASPALQMETEGEKVRSWLRNTEK